MPRNIEQRLLDLDFAALTRGPFTPSPALHRLGLHPPQDLKPWGENAWQRGEAQS